jgi:transcriptional regulator with XRE-family HTH domain
MGSIIRFPRNHVRASSKSARLRAAKFAKTSSVTHDFPQSSASRIIRDQCGLGMPLDRQPLTVLSSCPSALATTPVPPQASIIDGQVISMTGTLVRKLRTCQALAICETTIRAQGGQILPMDTNIDVARRLIAVREHFKLNQMAFAGKLNLAKNTLNAFETSKRPLTLETAKRIRQRFGVSVDWLLFGDIGQPSHDLVLKLGPSPTVQKETAPLTPPSKRKNAGRRPRT